MKKITLFLLAIVFNLNTHAQAPANDTCSGAVSLQVSADTCQNPYTDNNANATDSQQGGNACVTAGGGDLWYQLTAPASGYLTIETGSVAGSNLTDTGIAVYSGTCDNLTLLGCNDDGAGLGAFSKLELANLTPGETLYVRVLFVYQGVTGDFKICAYDPQASSLQDHQIQGFSITPNPAHDQVMISAQEPIQNIEIYDLTGKKVISQNPSALQSMINLSDLKNGVYYVKAKVNGQTSAYKLIKK